MAQIKFRIKKDGTIISEVDGVVGPSCKDITKLFTDALGQIVHEEDKPEIYEQIADIEAELYNAEE